MKQNTNTDTSREVILTESKTMRKEYIDNEQNYDILDKIKAIPYLNDDMVLSVEQVSNYYEVSNEAIQPIMPAGVSACSSEGQKIKAEHDAKKSSGGSCGTGCGCH